MVLLCLLSDKTLLLSVSRYFHPTPFWVSPHPVFGSAPPRFFSRLPHPICFSPHPIFDFHPTPFFIFTPPLFLFSPTPVFSYSHSLNFQKPHTHTILHFPDIVFQLWILNFFFCGFSIFLFVVFTFFIYGTSIFPILIFYILQLCNFNFLMCRISNSTFADFQFLHLWNFNLSICCFQFLRL